MDVLIFAKGIGVYMLPPALICLIVAWKLGK